MTKSRAGLAATYPAPTKRANYADAADVASVQATGAAVEAAAAPGSPSSSIRCPGTMPHSKVADSGGGRSAPQKPKRPRSFIHRKGQGGGVVAKSAGSSASPPPATSAASSPRSLRSPQSPRQPAAVYRTETQPAVVGKDLGASPAAVLPSASESTSISASASISVASPSSPPRLRRASTLPSGMEETLVRHRFSRILSIDGGDDEVGNVGVYEDRPQPSPAVPAPRQPQQEEEPAKAPLSTTGNAFVLSPPPAAGTRRRGNSAAAAAAVATAAAAAAGIPGAAAAGSVLAAAAAAAGVPAAAAAVAVVPPAATIAADASDTIVIAAADVADSTKNGKGERSTEAAILPEAAHPAADAASQMVMSESTNESLATAAATEVSKDEGEATLKRVETAAGATVAVVAAEAAAIGPSELGTEVLLTAATTTENCVADENSSEPAGEPTVPVALTMAAAAAAAAVFEAMVGAIGRGSHDEGVPDGVLSAAPNMNTRAITLAHPAVALAAATAIAGKEAGASAAATTDSDGAAEAVGAASAEALEAAASAAAGTIVTRLSGAQDPIQAAPLPSATLDSQATSPLVPSSPPPSRHTSSNDATPAASPGSGLINIPPSPEPGRTALDQAVIGAARLSPAGVKDRRRSSVAPARAGARRGMPQIVTPVALSGDSASDPLAAATATTATAVATGGTAGRRLTRQLVPAVVENDCTVINADVVGADSGGGSGDAGAGDDIRRDDSLSVASQSPPSRANVSEQSSITSASSRRSVSSRGSIGSPSPPQARGSKRPSLAPPPRASISERGSISPPPPRVSVGGRGSISPPVARASVNGRGSISPSPAPALRQSADVGGSRGRGSLSGNPPQAPHSSASSRKKGSNGDILSPTAHGSSTRRSHGSRSFFGGNDGIGNGLRGSKNANGFADGSGGENSGRGAGATPPPVESFEQRIPPHVVTEDYIMYWVPLDVFVSTFKLVLGGWLPVDRMQAYAHVVERSAVLLTSRGNVSSAEGNRTIVRSIMRKMLVGCGAGGNNGGGGDGQPDDDNNGGNGGSNGVTSGSNSGGNGGEQQQKPEVRVAVDMHRALQVVMEALLTRQDTLEHKLRRLFDDGDDNGDGVLSFDEFSAIVRRVAPHFGERRVLRMFREALTSGVDSSYAIEKVGWFCRGSGFGLGDFWGAV
ncbi:unnamed protein product [Phaeothamnion confervicola]